MQNGGEESQAAADSAPVVPEEITKHTYRVKVWKHLEHSGLAMFPRPVYNRIPNFKGAQEAAAKLAELDVFKNATHINVNPDKPQEPVRMLCLESNKTLYVPVPRLSKAFLNRIELPEGETRASSIRKAVSRNGMDTYGKPLALGEDVTLDLFVMGSVAVSKDGYRIGKGKGYGDLEFGLLKHVEAIQPSTLVVTIVHDCQVYDTLPSDLFGPHDVPIDIIVTPTQVIHTQHKLRRPPGLIWNLLSFRRVSLMPVLGQLHSLEIGCEENALKEVDTDVEERPANYPRRFRRRTRSHKSHNEGERDEGNTTEGETSDGRSRRQPRRRNKSMNKDDKNTPTKPRRPRKPRPLIDFSVKISNISPSSRVRELKQALTERGVKPQIMVWKGFKGFCYLHFLKAPQKGEGDGATPLDMEGVLSALAEMSLQAESEDKPRVLTVEPAPPRPTNPEEQQPQPETVVA